MPLDTIAYIGWTLMCFLWQGTLLATVLFGLLLITRSAPLRHALSLATVALMVITPVATFLLALKSNLAADAFASTLSVHWIAQFENITAFPKLPALSLSTPEVSHAPWMLWFDLAWLMGVILLAIRAAGGWYIVSRLRAGPTLPLPAEILRRCRDLQTEFEITGSVRFFQSVYVNSPIVIGWLRPTILIPTDVVTRLQAHQLDTLVAHELGHIRRFDAFTNVLLILVETALFFHPGVWWATRRVRVEREHCCDDLAALCSSPSDYIEALTSLEKSRAYRGPVLAAAVGDLRERAARLLGSPSAPEFRGAQYIFATLLLMAGCSVIMTTTLAAAASALSPPQISLGPKAACISANASSTSCMIMQLPTSVSSRQAAVRAAVVSKNGKQLLLVLASFNSRQLSKVNCGWERVHSLAVIECVVRRHRLNTSPMGI